MFLLSSYNLSTCVALGTTNCYVFFLKQRNLIYSFYDKCFLNTLSLRDKKFKILKYICCIVDTFSLKKKTVSSVVPLDSHQQFHASSIYYFNNFMQSISFQTLQNMQITCLTLHYLYTIPYITTFIFFFNDVLGDILGVLVHNFSLIS